MRCGLDVAVISLAVAAMSFALKRTVLADRPRLAMLVTYAAGVLVYAVYISIAECDALFAFKNFAAVLERGLAIGTLAMLICAAIERFTGGGDGLTSVEQLIERLVPEQDVEECARKLLAAISEGTDGLSLRLAEIIAAYADGADADEVNAAAERICAAFADGNDTTE